MIPSGYKEDVVYSVIPESGAGDLSFTRASDGTRINSAGLVENMPYNLLQYSEQFENGYWGKARISITANTIAAPNGTMTADSMVEDTTTNSHPIFRSITTTNATVYTVSIFAKQGSRQYLRINATNGGSPIYYDLLNKTVGAGGSIVDFGGGWCRLIYTYTTNSTSGEIYIEPSITNTTTTYLGNGSTSTYIWGAQLVAGSSAKEYFATTNRQDVPRLNYQNGGGGCPSLLLEPQRTNLVTYSEQFENAAWTKTQSSITSNSIIAPDGNLSADKLVEGVGSVQPTVLQNLGQLNTTLSQTVYAKAGERSILALGSNTSDNTSAYAIFDLTNGVCKALTSAKLASFSITSVGNGWYRCTVNFIASTSTAGHRVVIAVGNDYNASFSSAISPLPAYTGNGSSGLYIWGAQLEAGTYATSYIPTTSASATRVADACFKTGISSLIGQTQGTIFYDGIRGNETEEMYLFLQKNGSTGVNDSIYIIKEIAGISAKVYVSGFQVNIVGGSYSINQRIKIAFAYSSTSCALYVNGVEIGTDSSATIPTCANLQVGTYTGAPSNPIYMANKVNQVALFKTRLTNTELAQLTSI